MVTKKIIADYRNIDDALMMLEGYGVRWQGDSNEKPTEFCPEFHPFSVKYVCMVLNNKRIAYYPLMYVWSLEKIPDYDLEFDQICDFGEYIRIVFNDIYEYVYAGYEVSHILFS